MRCAARRAALRRSLGLRVHSGLFSFSTFHSSTSSYSVLTTGSTGLASSPLSAAFLSAAACFAAVAAASISVRGFFCADCSLMGNWMNWEYCLMRRARRTGSASSWASSLR